MNLNNYDCITEKLNKTKTWVDIHKKLLLSREIKYRPYTCLLKRYNIKNNTCKSKTYIYSKINIFNIVLYFL